MFKPVGFRIEGCELAGLALYRVPGDFVMGQIK